MPTTASAGDSGVEEPRALASAHSVPPTMSVRTKPEAPSPATMHWVCLETE